MKTLFSIIIALICTSIFAQDAMYVHTTTASNITGNFTTLDHPDLNNNPSACINYVHNWNPEGPTGVYNDNPDGLWYNPGSEKWTIYNEITANDMIVGASFNIYIAEDGQCIDHIATEANIFGSSTDIDDVLFNGANPGPYAFMNTYFNPNQVYNSGNWATYFYTTGDVRSIFEQNNGDVPVGAAFKIAIPSASTSRFTHIATAANTSSNSTTIDHPDLNGNQNATFLFMHYFGVEPGTSVQLDARLSVWYDGSNWNIYREDLGDMPEGVAFDIAVAPNETLGIESNELIDQTNIFPNPAIDTITISAPNKQLKRITIYSILGTEISVYDANTSGKTINISSLPSGTYLAKIETDSTTKTMKFIKS